MKLHKNIFAFLGKHGATMLSIAASVGVVVTAVETAKATTKAQKLIDMNAAEPMTKKEVVKDCWKFYIPAAVVGAGTIACILGSNGLNKKTQAELMAAYVAVQQTYAAYRKKVAEQYGEEAEHEIHRQVEQGPRAEDGDAIRLFYELYTNRYFNATLAQVYEAAYMLNKKLAIEGGVSLEAWCEMLGLEYIPDDKSRGWCIDQMVDEWEYYWLDVECMEQKMDDGLDAYYVSPWADPVANWEHYSEQMEYIDQKIREFSSASYGGETNE